MGIIPIQAGLAVLFATFVFARVVQERALRKLDTHAKGRLVEVASSYRLEALLPMAGLAAGYVAISMFDGLSVGVLLAIYLPVVLVTTVVLQLLVHRKMAAANIDREYIRVHSMCCIVMYMGLAALILAL